MFFKENLSNRDHKLVALFFKMLGEAFNHKQDLRITKAFVTRVLDCQDLYHANVLFRVGGHITQGFFRIPEEDLKEILRSTNET